MVEPGAAHLEPVPQEGQPPGDRPDDEDERQPDDHPAPVEVGEDPVGDGEAQPEQHDERQQHLEPVHDVVHGPVVVVVALDGAHRERADEHREEAVAAHHLGDTVGEEQGGQREQRLAHLGQAQ